MKQEFYQLIINQIILLRFSSMISEDSSTQSPGQSTGSVALGDAVSRAQKPQNNGEVGFEAILDPNLQETLNKVSSDISYLRELLDFQNQQQYRQLLELEVPENAEIIALLGPTQSGKSTLISFLLSEEIIVPQFCKDQYVEIQFKGAYQIKLGNAFVSQTSFPQIYKDPKNPTIFYLDTPGFGDNRDNKQSLKNMIAIHAALKKFKKVKCIFVCRISSFENINIIKSLKLILQKLFPGILDLEKKESKISLVATFTGAEQDSSFLINFKNQYERLHKFVFKKLANAKERYSDEELKNFISKLQQRSFSSLAFRAIQQQSQNEHESSSFKVYMLKGQNLTNYIKQLRKDIQETKQIQYSQTKMLLQQHFNDIFNKFASLINFNQIKKQFEEKFENIILSKLQKGTNSLKIFRKLVQLILVERDYLVEVQKAKLVYKQMSFKCQLLKQFKKQGQIDQAYYFFTHIEKMLCDIRIIAEFFSQNVDFTKFTDCLKSIQQLNTTHKQNWQKFLIRMFQKTLENKIKFYESCIVEDINFLPIQQIAEQLKKASIFIDSTLIKLKIIAIVRDFEMEKASLQQQIKKIEKKNNEDYYQDFNLIPKFEKDFELRYSITGQNPHKIIEYFKTSSDLLNEFFLRYQNVEKIKLKLQKLRNKLQKIRSQLDITLRKNQLFFPKFETFRELQKLILLLPEILENLQYRKKVQRLYQNNEFMPKILIQMLRRKNCQIKIQFKNFLEQLKRKRATSQQNLIQFLVNQHKFYKAIIQSSNNNLKGSKNKNLLSQSIKLQKITDIIQNRQKSKLQYNRINSFKMNEMFFPHLQVEKYLNFYEKVFSRQEIKNQFNKFFCYWLQRTFTSYSSIQKISSAKQQILGNICRDKKLNPQAQKQKFDKYFNQILTELINETSQDQVELKNLENYKNKENLPVVYFGKNVIISKDIKTEGRNLYLIAQNLLVLPNSTIDLSSPEIKQFEKPSKYNIEPENGKPGKPSGNMFVIANSIDNKYTSIKVNLSGGVGQKGQNAGSPPQIIIEYPKFKIFKAIHYQHPPIPYIGTGLINPDFIADQVIKKQKQKKRGKLGEVIFSENLQKNQQQIYSDWRDYFYKKIYDNRNQKKPIIFTSANDDPQFPLFQQQVKILKQNNQNLYVFYNGSSRFMQEILPLPNFYSSRDEKIQFNREFHAVTQREFCHIYKLGSNGINAKIGGIGGYNGYNGAIISNLNEKIFFQRQISTECGYTEQITQTNFLKLNKNIKIGKFGTNGKPSKKNLNKGVTFAWDSPSEPDIILGYFEQFNNGMLSTQLFKDGIVEQRQNWTLNVPEKPQIDSFQTIHMIIINQLLKGKRICLSAINLRLSIKIFQDYIQFYKKFYPETDLLSLYYKNVSKHSLQWLEVMQKCNVKEKRFSDEDFISIIKNIQAHVKESSQAYHYNSETIQGLLGACQIYKNMKQTALFYVPIKQNLDDQLNQIKIIVNEIEQNNLQQFKKNLVNSEIEAKKAKSNFVSVQNYKMIRKQMDQAQDKLFEALKDYFERQTNLFRIQISKLITQGNQSIKALEALQNIGLIFGGIQNLVMITGFFLDPTGGLISESASQILKMAEVEVSKDYKTGSTTVLTYLQSINLERIEEKVNILQQKLQIEELRNKLPKMKDGSDQKQEAMKKIKQAEEKQQNKYNFKNGVRIVGSLLKQNINMLSKEIELQNQKMKISEQIKKLQILSQSIDNSQNQLNKQITQIMASSAGTLKSLESVFLSKSSVKSGQSQIDFMKLVYVIKNSQKFFTMTVNKINLLIQKIKFYSKILKLEEETKEISQQISNYLVKLNFHISYLLQTARYVESLIQTKDMYKFIGQMMIGGFKQENEIESKFMNVIKRARMSFNLQIVKENLRLRDFPEGKQAQFRKQNQNLQQSEKSYMGRYLQMASKILDRKSTTKIQRLSQKTKLSPLYHWTGVNFKHELTRLLGNACKIPRSASFEENSAFYVKFESFPLYWNEYSCICLSGAPQFTLYHPSPHVLILKQNNIFFKEGQELPTPTLKRVLLLNSMQYQIGNDSYKLEGPRDVPYLINNSFNQILKIASSKNFSNVYTESKISPDLVVTLDKSTTIKRHDDTHQMILSGNEKILIQTDRISPYGTWYLMLKFEKKQYSFNLDQVGKCILRLEAPWSAIQTKRIDQSMRNNARQTYNKEFLGEKWDYNVRFGQL